MAEVIVDKNKPIQFALNLFKKRVNEDGTLRQLKKHEYHIKPSVKKRLKSQEARKALKKLNKKRQSNAR